MDACLSLADFEAYRRDVLEPAQRARMSGHLERCEVCRSTYHELCADEAFLADASPILGSIMDTSQTHSVPERDAAPHVHLPRIEGYEVIRLIGRGGMAAVYEAIQLKLNRKVALKLLPAVAGSAQPSLVTRFKREATAAAKLHHTNIVPIYDFGESRDGYYYAMELIHGLSLREMIRRLAAANAPEISATMLAALVLDSDLSSVEVSDSGAGTPAGTGSVVSGGSTSSLGRNRTYYWQIARWIADVAGALHYAHVCGVVHRDIKPGNLILSTDGRIMVADFGLAKTSEGESVTRSGSLLGTYRYMSPEQIGAKRLKVDARTDVYSLGVTLYELLTLQPVFPALDREELLGQIMFREPVAPRKIISSVPGELQTICLKAMEKSPDARYASAAAMADDLRRYIDDLPIVARPTGLVGRARKFVTRRPALSAFIGLLVVSVVATGWFVQRERWYVQRDQINQQRAAEAESARLQLLKTSALTAYKEGRFEDAVNDFSELLEAQPDELKWIFNVADQKKNWYGQNNDMVLIEEAEQLVDRGLNVSDNPYSCQFLNLKSVLCRIREDYPAAIKFAKRATEIDPTDYKPWCNLGFTYVLMDDFAQAEDAWRLSMDKAAQTNVPMTRCNLGALYIHRNNPEVTDVLMPAYENDKRDVYTLLHLARMYLEVDSLRDAKLARKFADSADTGVKDHRNDLLGPRIKRVVALAALANEEWEDAIESAAKALEYEDGPRAFAYGILAVAYARLGNQEMSAANFKEFENNWPDSMKADGYKAVQVDATRIWIDSNRVLEQLRHMAKSGEGQAAIP